MLAAHRSGLTDEMLELDGGKLWARLRDMKTNLMEARIQATQSLLDRAPRSTPGSTFLYSNWNYILLGEIVEKISGLSWEEKMQNDLFKPLKMSSCVFGSAVEDRTLPPQNPWPHHLLNNKAVALSSQDIFDNPAFFGPAGTVSCNLRDWSAFLQAHIDGFNGKDTKILKTESFIPLHAPYPGQEYTSGGWWRIERPWAQGPVLQHTGSNTLNSATAWLAPRQNRGYAVVTNIAGPNAEKSMDAVVAELINDR